MEFRLTESMLAQLIRGNTQVGMWYDALVDVLPDYGITTERRMAHFISQCAHESNNFRSLEENLNYSVETLLRIFPNHFGPNSRNPVEYASQPEKLANYVYMDQYRSKRGALGNIHPGDGWRFRGRGLKQLTGRSNYTAFGKTIDMTAEEAASYVGTYAGAVESACWFWDNKNLNAIADTDDVVRMTHAINGGENGLADRTQRYNHAMRVFGASADAPPQSSSVDFNTVLRVGSNNDTVRAVQSLLGIQADGVFGRGTEAAVKSWQAANGLEADGIVGPATLSRMFGE